MVMSQTDAEAKVQSEDIEDVTVDNAKLVPVAESIRYRKRAQAAEQKIEQLNEQLKSVRDETQELTGKMKQLETEQSLTKKLIAAGASDIETALLVAKTRAADDDADTDTDAIVEQLKNDKPHLFGSARQSTVPQRTRTAGVKDSVASNRMSLSKAAARAASTGSRDDLHEYLRLRRNYL
jgi:chromosome segregation ATPase